MTPSSPVARVVVPARGADASPRCSDTPRLGSRLVTAMLALSLLSHTGCPTRVVHQCPPARGSTCAARASAPHPARPVIRPRASSRFSFLRPHRFSLPATVPLPQTVALSPDGTLAAVGGRWGGLQVLRLRDGKVLFNLGHTEELSRALRVAFSPDGGILVSAGHDHTRIRVWSVTKGTMLREFRAQGFPIRDVAIGPAGVSVLGTSKGAEVWDLRTGVHRATIRMPYDLPVVRVATARNGLLAAGDRTGEVRLFRTTAPERGVTIPSPGKRLTALALSPDGRLVATGHENGQVLLHRTSPPRRVRSFTFHAKTPPLAIRFPAHAQELVVAESSGRVDHVSTDTGRLLASEASSTKLPGPGSLALSRDGSLLALAGRAGQIVLWQSEDSHRALRLPARYAPPPVRRPEPTLHLIRPTPIRIDVSGYDVTSFAVGRRGQFLALAGRPPQIRVFYLNFTPRAGKAPRAAPLYRRRPPPKRRRKTDRRVHVWVAATPNRQWLFAHGGGFYLHRWAFPSGRPIPLWVRQRGLLRGLLPLHDGKTLVTLSSSKVLGWSLSGNLKFSFEGLDPVYFMGSSRDSKTLVLVQGWDRFAAFDLPSGRPRWSQPSGPVKSLSLLAMVFPPKGGRLLTYHRNGFLRVYDLALGTIVERRRLPLATAATRCAFRPDGKILACSLPQGVIFLEIPSGAHVGSLPWPRGVDAGRIRDLAYSDKGNVLVAQLSRRQLVAFSFDRPDQPKPYRGVEALVRIRLGLSIRPPRIRTRPSALPQLELLPARGSLRRLERPTPRRRPPHPHTH